MKNRARLAFALFILTLGFAGNSTAPSAAQTPNTFLYLASLHKEAFRLPGEIREVQTAQGAPGFIGVTYNPVAGNLGDVFWFLVFSRNNGADWQRIPSRPWENTGLIFAFAEYTFAHSGQDVVFFALVYGSNTVEEKWIVDLYRSEDFGSTWGKQPVTVPALCADRSPRAVLSAATASATVLYLQVSCQIPNPNGPSDTINFVSVSSDLGDGWTLLPNQPMENAYIVPSPADGDRLFRFGAANSIAYSDDGGQTWVSTGTPPVGIPILSGVDPSRLSVVGPQSGFVSFDSGRTWQIWQDPDCPWSTGGYSYAERQDASIAGFLVCANGRVLSTDDNGQMWRTVGSIPVRLSIGSYQLFSDRSATNSLLVVERGVGGALWRLDPLTGNATPLILAGPPEWSAP